MIYSYYVSVKKKYPVTGHFNPRACVRTFFKAIWGMLSVLFVVVGVITRVYLQPQNLQHVQLYGLW